MGAKPVAGPTYTREQLIAMGAKPVASLDPFAQMAQPPKQILGSTTLADFATGLGKGELSTLKGIGTIGQKVVDTVYPQYKENTQGNNLFRTGTPEEQKVAEGLTPSNTGESVGKFAEQTAEYFLPASKAVEAERLVATLATGISYPILAATARITGKGLVQGTAAGAVKLAQTGDLKSALETSATAGIARGAIASIGEGARAIKLPERLYSTIFKNSASDMMNELKTENLVDLAKNNPEKYADFVKQGIISDSATGPVLNETVAKQALDSGLRGSIRNMARTVINGALDSEQAVQNSVKTYKGTVDLTEKQFPNILNKIATDYEDVGFGEISSEASRLAKVISSSGGQVDAETALAVRRLLDRARIASSFDKPASSLSMTQSNLKTLTDTVRSRVNAIPGLGDIMSKYSFYIDAIDTLAKEAARRGNNQALSMIDSLFLSSAFGGNNLIPGLTAGITRKILMSGQGVTSLAQLLNKGTASAATIGATSATAGAGENLLKDANL